MRSFSRVWRFPYSRITNLHHRPFFSPKSPRGSFRLPSAAFTAGCYFLCSTVGFASAAAATQEFILLTTERAGPKMTPNSCSNAPRATIVFVHGLDSAKDTWSDTMVALADQGYASIAVDLRGHGESPLGKEEEFTIDNMVRDIRGTLRAQGISSPFVLVGHSMGGMVVMQYAAQYPEDLKALVIEDMDLRPRQLLMNLSPKDLEKRRAFSRSFHSFEQASTELQTFGFDAPRIQGWITHGRIFQRADRDVWSNINPLAQYLACQRVLNTKDAIVAFSSFSAPAPTTTTTTLQKTAPTPATTTKPPADERQMLSCPVHLWVAGIGSACKIDGLWGVQHMQNLLPSLQVTYFPQAHHSIHRSEKRAIAARLQALADGHEGVNVD